jgi:phosphoserine phosphatase
MDTWALVDWDNTIRPGFVMIDWVDYLTGHKLISPALADSMRDHERLWLEGENGYHDFIQSIVSIYQRIEPVIDPSRLRDLAEDFVLQDQSFLNEGKVGSTVLQLFNDLNIDVHVVSGGPLVILHEYQRCLHCIKRVTGISSSTNVSSLLTLKRDAARTYAASPALFGIGDSETDIPLFECARHPIGINFAPVELKRKGGLSVSASTDLVLSHEAHSQLSSYIRTHHVQAS